MAGWFDTDELVVGGTGMVYFAPSATSPPTGIPAVSDRTPTGFTGLGYHDEDGLSLTVTPNIQEFLGWQSKQPLRREALALEILQAFKLGQWNEDTVPLAFGGGSISGDGSATTPYRYDFPTDTQALNEIALVADVDDGSKRLRFCWKRGNVTEPVEAAFNRSNLSTLAVGFKALAPTGGGSPGYFLTTHSGFAAGS